MSHERTVREFIELGNRVIPGERFSIVYRFKVGTCVAYDGDEYVLGIGIGPDHELSGDVQSSILRLFGLEELQDRFGFEVWEP